jgi:hypothetical protein
MDGAKLITDTVDYSNEYVIGRCLAWAEAFPGGNVDRAKLQILVVVGS